MDDMPQPLSSSEETDSTEEEDSGEEDEDEKAFVRRERMQQKKNADKPARSLHEGSEEEGDEQDQSDQDDREEDAVALTGRDSATSSSNESADHHGSETTSASDGSRQANAAANANANANRGKKGPAAEVVAKPKPKPDASPKKRKEKASKRDREEQSIPENSPSKKQKIESFDRTTMASEHVPKGKDSAKAANRVKISTSKKSEHASASAEKSEDLSAQQNSVRKLETKKAGEKVKNSRKAPKNEETEHAGGLSSPGKPKLFTGKDEIVLTSEILRDIQRGINVPSKETDEYWSKFAERVDGRMEGSWSKEQLCKKLKRMKQRYMGMAEKFKNSGEHKFRNTVDEELYAMWSKMWGDGSALNADADDVKHKKSQAVATASPVKAGKASRNKATAPLRDVKVVKDEAAARKGVSNSSQSEESNGGSDSPNEIRTVSVMGTESKDTYAENNLLPHSTDVLLRTLCRDIHAILAEVQESSRKNQKHWQSRAFSAVEMAIKAFADQSRSSRAFHMESFDGSGILSKYFDLNDSHLYEGDHTLQQEWRELRLKELEVYRQRLELVQRECQLKEERLKALLQRRK